MHAPEQPDPAGGEGDHREHVGQVVEGAQLRYRRSEQHAEDDVLEASDDQEAALQPVDDEVGEEVRRGDHDEEHHDHRGVRGIVPRLGVGQAGQRQDGEADEGRGPPPLTIRLHRTKFCQRRRGDPHFSSIRRCSWLYVQGQSAGQDPLFG
ncbi:MAG: hypothetical protein DRJ42_17880 [Deltaproteobacteria bacterium]|nr:MAG: hypothetical protein DRJ42_17880 [Deltaproteobacteria bacterium]